MMIFNVCIIHNILYCNILIKPILYISLNFVYLCNSNKLFLVNIVLEMGNGKKRNSNIYFKKLCSK